MRVGFFHAEPAEGASPHLALASQLVASIRKAMPGVAITHFTDDETPDLSGVDETIRRTLEPGLWALGCLEHYAAVEGEWLFVDSDVLVRKDVRHIFSMPFDVAVASRDGTLVQKDIGTRFMSLHPYNKGVVFSRSQAFWEDALIWLQAQPMKSKRWMGDQRAMNAVIAEGEYCVKVLPNSYNYPPRSQGEEVRDKHILHLKGERKTWRVAA